MNRLRWRILPVVFLSSAMLVAAARAQTNEARSMVLVIGAPGEPEYAEQFSSWAGLWKKAAAKGDLQSIVIGEDKDKPDEDLRR